MTRRLWAGLRTAWDIAMTPVMVGQNARIDPQGNVTDAAGWAYRQPICQPDMDDPAVAAAVKAGRIRPDDTDEPRRLVTAPAHTKAEEN